MINSTQQASFGLTVRTVADEVLDLARITEARTEIAMAIYELTDVDANSSKAVIASDLYRMLERLHAIEEAHRDLENRWKTVLWLHEEYKEQAAQPLVVRQETKQRIDLEELAIDLREQGAVEAADALEEWMERLRQERKSARATE